MAATGHAKCVYRKNSGASPAAAQFFLLHIAVQPAHENWGLDPRKSWRQNREKNRSLKKPSFKIWKIHRGSRFEGSQTLGNLAAKSAKKPSFKENPVLNKNPVFVSGLYRPLTKTRGWTLGNPGGKIAKNPLFKKPLVLATSWFTF